MVQVNQWWCLRVKSLEVEPVTRVLQELSIRVDKGVCPFLEETVDDVWVIPHWLELSFAQLVIGLVIDQNHIAFTEGARVDMGVIMGLLQLQPVSQISKKNWTLLLILSYLGLFWFLNCVFFLCYKFGFFRLNWDQLFSFISEVNDLKLPFV